MVNALEMVNTPETDSDRCRDDCREKAAANLLSHRIRAARPKHPETTKTPGTTKTPPQRGFQVVGDSRFELLTSSVSGKRASQLRQSPEVGTGFEPV